MTERAAFDRGEVDLARSAWCRGAPALDLPRLEGDCTADVAVVGAGLAGTSVALHLAAGGASVALVEACEPGWGASGRNAGHVVPHRDLDRALGALPDRGERLLALLRDEGDIVYRLARAHRIECDAVQGGYLQVVQRPGLVGAARRRAEKWAGRGFRVRFVDREEVAELTGSERFCAGVLDEAGGRMNPFLFTRGLALAARDAGARVYARSPVESVERREGRWSVSTAGGRVLAGRVVVCTNGYTTDLVPALARAWCPLVVHALSLRPLPEPLRLSILPRGTVISQFPTGNHPTLLDGLGRLVSSSLPSPVRPHRPEGPLHWMLRWLRRTYPRLREVDLELEGYWTGATAWSPDQLPRIFEVAPGLHALMCFSGEGNVLAPLLGKHLAESLLRDDASRLPLPPQAPTAVRWRKRYDFVLRKVAVPLIGALERV